MSFISLLFHASIHILLTEVCVIVNWRTLKYYAFGLYFMGATKLNSQNQCCMNLLEKFWDLGGALIYKKYISRSQTLNRHNSPFKTLLGLTPLLSDCNKNFSVLQFEVNGSTEKIWSIWGLQSRSMSTLESCYIYHTM